MPQRRTIQTLSTPELQGEDSWVKVRKVSGTDGLRLLTLSQKWAAGDGKEPVDRAGILGEICQIMVGSLIDWNWVDDEGEPLAKPGEIDKLMDVLSMEEILGLSTAIRQGPPTQGN